MGLTLIFMWKWLNTALKAVASFSFNLSIDQGARKRLHTGNLIIDSILNSKLSEAVEKDISVSVHVMLPADVKIETDDMVVILGNVLDNAIEACEQIPTDKRLELMLKYEDGCIIVSVRNSFDGNMNRKGDVFVSLKSDKSLHGIGLQSVRHTVEKHNGEMQISTTKNIFSVDAILYA